VRDKVKDYLKAGVHVVWDVNPAKETVTEHRRGKKAYIYRKTDTLTIEDVIPGFRMLVAEAFRL
jgi:hypothetical protein